MFQVRSAPARMRVWAGIATVVMYLLVVQASSFLHHDAQCHRTSRTHCTSCSFSLSASGVADEVGVRILSLSPAERLAGDITPAFTVVPRVFASDSSPPVTIS